MITAVLILILAYAGISKLIHVGLFKFELSLSPNLKTLAGWLCWLIPTMEILLSILFFIKRVRTWAFVFSAILFLSYLWSMFVLRRYVPNIRGGVLNYLSFNQYVLLNSIFLILSVFASALLLFKRRGGQIKEVKQTALFT